MAQLIGLAIVAAVALYVAWPLLERPLGPLGARSLADEIADLTSRRDTVYRQLADLEFDHSLGKVDDEDYAQQREDLLDEAALVLMRLDSVPSGRPELQTSIAAAREAEIEAEIRRLRRNGDAP
jgi:membrane protein implicated in regulation of membrane protease activity